MTIEGLARAFLAAALAFALAAATGCSKDVYLGVDPGSDAAALDGGDAGAPD